MAGCKTYPAQGNLTRRRNSAINFPAMNFQSTRSSELHVDLSRHLLPGIITGENLHPDMDLVTTGNCLYILELTMDFETNINSDSSQRRYMYLYFQRSIQ